MTVISVISRTQKIVVDPSSSAVGIINQGPMGPTGPAGPTTPAPTAWTNVGFQNSWVNVGGGFQTMQYRRVNDTVQLRGMIKDGIAGQPAFTLPAGFRPPANITIGAITINATGEVIPSITGQNVSVLESYSSIA